MDENEQQKLMYEAQVYQQELGMIKNEVEKVTLTLLDLNNAMKTIEGLKEEQGVIPIGGNAFIEAKVSSDNVLVPIGGGYLMKMKKMDAKKEIEKRADSTKKVIERLRNEYETITRKYLEIESRLRQGT